MAEDELYAELYGEAEGEGHDLHQPPASASVQAAPGPPPGSPAPGDARSDALAEAQGGSNIKASEELDDDFEVHLDESDAAADGNASMPAAGVPGFRYTRVPNAPRPHGQAAPNFAQPPGAPAAGRGPFAGGRGSGMRPWRPQFIPIGATSIEKDASMAFPESAQPGQAIKLPGQTRVTPEEYSEFTTLGQGGVYELDLDRVADAPWRIPGADMGDFFNYDLTPAKWRGYVKEIQQAFAESRLQERVHLYEPSATIHDPDMPTDLAAALGRKAAAGGIYRPSSTGALQGRTERLEAPDAIIVLASSVEA